MFHNVATIRMTHALYEALKSAAHRAEKSMNQFCVDVLRAALPDDLRERVADEEAAAAGNEERLA